MQTNVNTILSAQRAFHISIHSIMPQPLPLNPYAVGSFHSDAYVSCVNMEAYALGLPPQDRGPSVLVCARFLGYMILHAPPGQGRNNISTEIASCNNNFTRLCEVACKYIDHFVRWCECVVKDPLPNSCTY